MKRRFRYAPTPSRPLHVGNGLAALIGWATARAAGGRFVLRVEDIDRVRCRPEYEVTMLADLRWLGLDWDEGPDVGGDHGPYRQSERLGRYDAIAAELAARGLAYPCGCSRAQVRAAQRAPHLHDTGAGGERPYPGTCRPPATGVLERDRGGYRLNVTALGDEAVVTWDDAWTGAAREDVRETCGDFLLGRPGVPTYQLAVVADDVAMGVTDVVRGRDLSGSTARQLLLYRALGAAPPTFAHHPLVVDAEGRKLSKRDGDATLSVLRGRGVDPGALRSALLDAIGVSPDGGATGLAALVAAFADGPPAWRDGQLRVTW